MAELAPELFEPIKKQIREFIFSYKQRFFFVNSPRKHGKTMCFQELALPYSVKNKMTIGYVVRSEDEIKSGVVWGAFEKCINKHFPDMGFYEEKGNVCIKITDGETEEPFVAVKGFSLRSMKKLKRRNPSNVWILMFDEYMLEKDTPGDYVKGWNEPTLFMSIYDSIDRGADKLKCIFFGNNTSFYNPYHMYPAFKGAFQGVPESGTIRKTDNTVFWRIKTPPDLKKALEETEFGKMIAGTEYGRYAAEGEYEDDITAVVAMPAGAQTEFSLVYDGRKVFVHSGYLEDGRHLWFSMSGDTGRPCFAVRGNDVAPNIKLFRSQTWWDLFQVYYNKGEVFFADQKTKGVCQDFLYCILSNFRK